MNQAQATQTCTKHPVSDTSLQLPAPVLAVELGLILLEDGAVYPALRVSGAPARDHTDRILIKLFIKIVRLLGKTCRAHVIIESNRGVQLDEGQVIINTEGKNKVYLNVNFICWFLTCYCHS